MTIFVSVASYRDPELVHTVRDCLAKAARPGDLRIVVNWQHLGDEDVSALTGDPRVELIEFDARQSLGACWARAQVMRHYAGEDWFLQVDSHTRFAEGWDERVLALAAASGAPKPVVTCYPPMYEPAGEFAGGGVPTETMVSGWSDDGLPIFGQRELPVLDGRPAPARFVAGGFLFAPGSLVREVPYDPYLYFHGEELTVSLRAYTWGYDLFHPTELLAWHYYIREGSPRHWSDHPDAWIARDKASRRRVNTLLRHPNHGRYGLGRVRSLSDYADWSGCHFARRRWTDWRTPAAV